MLKNPSPTACAAGTVGTRAARVRSARATARRVRLSFRRGRGRETGKPRSLPSDGRDVNPRSAEQPAGKPPAPPAPVQAERGTVHEALLQAVAGELAASEPLGSSSELGHGILEAVSVVALEPRVEL